MITKVRSIAIAAVLSGACVATAATTDNPVGLVTGIYTYTDFGTGDVVVTSS